MSDDELDIVVPRRASPPRGPVPRIVHSESNGSKVPKSDSQSSTVEAPPPSPEEEMSLMQRMAMRMGGLNLESDAVAPAISSTTSSKDTGASKKPAKKLAPARSKAKKPAPVRQADSESEISCDGEIMSPPTKPNKSTSTISTTTQVKPPTRGRRAATKAKPTYIESASEEEEDVSSVDFDDSEEEESDYCPTD